MEGCGIGSIGKVLKMMLIFSMKIHGLKLKFIFIVAGQPTKKH